MEFKGDLYGETIEVRFIDRIRNEKRFSSVGELTKQIGRDVETVKTFFKRRTQ